MQALNVNAQVTLRDVIVSSWAVLWHAPQIRYALLGITFLLPLITVDSAASYIITVLAVFLLAVPATMAALALVARFNPNLERGVLGEHYYEVSDEGFREKTRYNETLHCWESLDIVREAFGLLMIRVSGSSWHSIPKHAFADKEHYVYFVSEVRENIRKSRE